MKSPRAERVAETVLDYRSFQMETAVEQAQGHAAGGLLQVSVVSTDIHYG